MEIILLERVAKLGQMGDIVTVKDGFARNYLLPQKKALRATTANKTAFEAKKAQLEATNIERRTEAEKLAQQLDGMRVVIIRAASEKGQLYGSVSARDISDAVTENGVTISRHQIMIVAPIKALGIYKIDLVLHPEVNIQIDVNVARSAEEADMQAAGETIESRAATEEAEARAEAEALLSEMGMAAGDDDMDALDTSSQEAPNTSESS